MNKQQQMNNSRQERYHRRITIVEGPGASRAWDEFNLPGDHAKLDQCRFGLKLPKHERLKLS